MIVLTGTPLENKLEELYSIVQVIDPLKLGALYRFVNQHQVIDEASGKITGYKELNKIGEHLKDILLRRHKRDVLKQLPKRMDKNIFVSMTEKQLDYYNEAKEAVSKLVNKWARFKFLNEIDRQFLLINLNRMRMACNSTFIIDQETRHDTKIDELMDILEAVFSNDNEKVVVFSQWERMTRIVAQELDARKIGYESLHGGVPSKQREQLFKNFNNDLSCKVFLSTDAGGVGLNLQAASVLVNLDLPWNPAVLEQRIGRIHRMGQKKNVQIINLISANTIEEEMLGKLKFKSSMAMGVLDNGEDTVFLGESKFAQLMKDVQTLTESGHEKPMALSEETKKEKEDAARTFGVTENKTDDEQRNLFDTKPETTVRVTANKKIEKNTPTHVHELLESSAGFLEKLFATLADKEKTEELVNTLVKQDESTGQSYLQIPLQNKESLAKGLAVLSQLFGGVKI